MIVPRIAIFGALLAAFAVSGCAHGSPPRVLAWACDSQESVAGATVSSSRELSSSGTEKTFSHSWVWQTRQGGVSASMQQRISDWRGGTSDDVVVIYVNPGDDARREARAVELRAGPAGATTVLAARRSSRRTFQHVFRPSLATVRELASTGRPLAVVLLDREGQALQTIPLDLAVVEPARAAWPGVIARSLEMTRDFRNQCTAELDGPPGEAIA